MTSIKGILFDLDQTLLDRESSLRAFLSHQWECCPDLQAISKNVYIQKFIELDDNGKVWKDFVYQEIIDYFVIQNITSPELVQQYLHDFTSHTRLFPHVLSSLHALKEQKFKLGIITNGRTDLQSSVVEATNLAKIMDIILISETEGVKKPDPVIFNRALSRLNITARECIFIGDNVKADIEGAQNVGMKAIWLRNAYFPSPHKDSGTFILENFKDLPKLIKKIRMEP